MTTIIVLNVQYDLFFVRVLYAHFYSAYKFVLGGEMRALTLLVLTLASGTLSRRPRQ